MSQSTTTTRAQRLSVIESKRYMALYGHTLIAESQDAKARTISLDYRSSKRPDVIFRMTHDHRGRLETSYL